MQFRIYIVDGTLGSLYLDQVRASGLFKEVLVSWYKLPATLVELFDRLAEVEGLSCALFDVGNQRCAIEQVSVIGELPRSCFA
jgi:hypothetical protein